MKKHLILLALVLGFSFPLLAEMKKDPVTNKFYSIPATPDINQKEYDELFFQCYWKSEQIMAHPTFKDSSQDLIKQGIAEVTTAFLKNVGTPTALRLLADIQKLNS